MDAALKANTSLAALNMIQGLIMNIGLGIMAVMAGFEAAATLGENIQVGRFTRIAVGE